MQQLKKYPLWKLLYLCASCIQLINELSYKGLE